MHVRRQKMTGMDKYNAIMDEAKLLAGIVSQEKSKDFTKARNVLKFVRTNIQNMGGDVLVAAASDYLGLKNQKKSTASNADKYGLLNDEEILAPVLKKSAGRTSTKRKKPSTEGNAGTTSNDGHACSLCSLKGHKKNNCPAGNTIGERYTMRTFAKIQLVVPSIGNIELNEIDPVVCSDAFGLQIIGQVKLCGEEPPQTVVYRSNIVLRNLSIRPGPPCHLNHETLAKWCNDGKSQSKIVFVNTIKSTSNGEEV